MRNMYIKTKTIYCLNDDNLYLIIINARK